MKKLIIGAAAAAAIVAGAWFGLPGLLAPQAPAVAFERLDGAPLPLSQLRGKVVLVNFWATSCVTCVKEMPDLVATHRKFHARGYETVAVAMSYDVPDYVQRFSESRELPFVVAMDRSGEVARGFGDVQLTPTTVLIDRHGRIVKRYVGRPDFAALHALVEDLLAAG